MNTPPWMKPPLSAFPTNTGAKRRKRSSSFAPGQQVTKEEMIEFLTARISKIEMPVEIEFRQELPRTLIGKLSKKELVAEEKAKQQ